MPEASAGEHIIAAGSDAEQVVSCE